MLYPTNANHETALRTLLDLHSFNVQNVGTVCRGFRSKFRPRWCYLSRFSPLNITRSWILLHLHIYPPIQSIETTYMHLQMGIHRKMGFTWFHLLMFKRLLSPWPYPHEKHSLRNGGSSPQLQRRDLGNTKVGSDLVFWDHSWNRHVTIVLQGWFLRELDENQVARTSALLAAAKFKIIPFLEFGRFPTRPSQVVIEAWGGLLICCTRIGSRIWLVKRRVQDATSN